MKKPTNVNYYAVAKGRSTGIFNSWSECQRQVDGFKHNSFKGFATLEGAIDFMRKAGIATEDIEVVEEEGDVLLRKPLNVVMPNYVSDDSTSNKTAVKRMTQTATLTIMGEFMTLKLGPLVLMEAVKVMELTKLLAVSENTWAQTIQITLVNEFQIQKISLIKWQS